MRKQGRGAGKYIWLTALFVIFAGAAFVSLAYLRYQSEPVIIEAFHQQPTVKPTTARALDWPAYGQSAIATKYYGVLATHGDTNPRPTASTAKLITLFSIMTKHPFSDGKGGVITFTEDDVRRYHAYVAGNGTVTPVAAGVEWTQYQAFQSIQIDSANNVSDSLAIWAFGSLEEYQRYTQVLVKSIGMNNTTIGTDASGYSPTTTSTAHDMAILMTHILQDSALRDIIGQSSAVLPWTGAIDGHSRINEDGFIGGKTGYIPEAGGTYVLAAKQTIDEHSHEIITVVLGAPHFAPAQRDAWTLYQSAKDNFSYQTVIEKGQRFGAYHPAWSNEIAITAHDDVGMFIWGGKQPELHTTTRPLQADGNREAGAVRITYGNWTTHAQLLADRPLERPPWWYGLRR